MSDNQTWSGEERRLGGICCVQIKEHEVILNGQDGLVGKVRRIDDTMNENQNKITVMWEAMYGENGFVSVQKEVVSELRDIKSKLDKIAGGATALNWVIKVLIPLILSAGGFVIGHFVVK